MQYKFRFQKTDGRIIRGSVSATDEQDARKQIMVSVGILLELKACSYPSLPLNVFISQGSVHGVMKQLSLMIGAALPLRESLSMVSKQQSSPRIRKILEDIYGQVSQGIPLSKAMAQHKRHFDSLCCAVIEAGEWSGDLATALSQYAEFLDERQKLRSSVRQALSYPILLLCVSCIVVSVLLTVAVPKIVSQLSISGIELPWSTKLVLGLGDVLRNGTPYTIAILVVLIPVSLRFYKKPTIKMSIHGILLKVPGIGRLFKRIQQVRLLMTLAILCSTAVPMANALRLSCSAVSNLWLKAKTTSAIQSLVEGAGFTQSLEKEALLPNDLLALLHAGEQSGKLNEVLIYLARVQRETLQQQLIDSVKLIEPVLIFSLGLIVMLVFMAIIQPMLTMNSINF